MLDSTTVFYKNTSITDVKLYEGVSFANNTMTNLFYGCSNLVNADLSGVNTTGVTNMSAAFALYKKLATLDMTGIDTSSVTTMYYLFSQCYKLESIAGYEDWNTSALLSINHTFDRVQSMEVIDLRKWDLSQINNSGWCFQSCYAKQILLPDNLKTISAGFMNHATKIEGTSFTIPAGVEKIGYAHTFYDFATSAFTEFVVAEGNENYVAIDGVLYSADGKEMLAIPRGKTFENNTYEIPEGVEFVGELSFSRNPNIKTVVVPSTLELKFVPARDPQYIVFEDSGNLNPGNNLNLAIYYQQVPVSSYEVKADNPRYESIDGIIYSEDMTTLLAIPTFYDKHINIPEGVTTLVYEASLSGSPADDRMSKCTGISIPSTLTNISSDQLDKLNRLRAKYPDTFTITVSPDNPAYSLDATGALVEKTS